MDRTASFYSSPSYTQGAGLPIYSGARRQRGGSIFGALKRLFLPVISAFGRKIAKRGAQEAVGLAKDVVADTFLGRRNAKDSLVNHGKKRALDLSHYAADEGLDSLQRMIGSGRQQRRRRRRQSLGKRKPVTKRRQSRKRKPKKKQRRTTKPLF